MKKRGRPPKIANRPFLSRTSLELKTETKQSLFVVLFFALAILTALSLLNISGNLGAAAVRGLRMTFGWGAFLLPILFILAAVSIMRDLREQKEKREPQSSTHVYIGISFLTLVIITILQLMATHESVNQLDIARDGAGGGLIGALISLALIKTIGPWAALILLVLGIVAAALITFNIPLSGLMGMFRRKEGGIAEREVINLKINDPLAAGFKTEEVGRANPISQTLSQGKPLPKFIQRPKMEVGKMQERQLGQAKAKVDKSWQFPPLELLDESNSNVDSGNIEANVAIIQKTLADFAIEVEMGEVNIGPTVTQYTLRPAEGVKLSAITALQNDLKLALAAPSIRIEAPIPGRSLVGVEIPNKTKAIVRLRELFQMEEFQRNPSPLAFVLGRDVSGKGVTEDLEKMPHLLIAGSTGSGKSVCINVLLTSLVMRNTPEAVKFIIIDPKRVEMSLYNDLPHLITPVITDHEKAVNALRWTVAEMDKRYRLLQEANKRNIGEYNEVSPRPMPYLVLVVDELASLMSVARSDVEVAIVKLAQMSRAVGIHLVLATQRPSVDILTGLIKANITARIAFNVGSQVDSRTILDQAGAEKLLGRGDLLYVTSEMSQPRRLQGALIGVKEIKKIGEFLRKEGLPSYDESVTQKIRVSAGGLFGGADSGDDPLLDEATRVVVEAGKASASLLQRRLKIGYARAARLLDILEEQGVVGPSEGAKPREVYGYSESAKLGEEESNDAGEQNSPL